MGYRILKELHGGENHTNLLAEMDGARVVIKRVRNKEDVPRLREQYERLFTLPEGVAPKPIALDAHELILEYIEGEPIDRWTEPILEGLANLLARVHSYTNGSMSDLVGEISSAWERHDRKAYEDRYERLLTHAPASAVPSALCHGDLFADNILLYRGEVRLIDWEWASYSDPALDIARLWSAGRGLEPWYLPLTREQYRGFVAAYLRQCPDAGLAARAFWWNKVQALFDLLYYEEALEDGGPREESVYRAGRDLALELLEAEENPLDGI